MSDLVSFLISMLMKIKNYLNDNVMFDLMYTANIRVSSISEIPTIRSYISVVTILKIKYKSINSLIKT